jgi:hypothetical protein
MAKVRCLPVPQALGGVASKIRWEETVSPRGPLAPWGNGGGDDGEVQWRRQGGTATVSIDPDPRILLYCGIATRASRSIAL